jgi:pimeloyl-ACP methyl ester carboxylesterase
MEKYFDLHSADFTIRCKIYFAGKNDVDGINMENAVGPGPVFKHVVLFCHGFAGHKDNAMANKLADRILERHDDTALVIFNWPGHGDDEHAGITLADCDAYLGAVLQYIQKELRPEILDASATSFGGYLVLKYISDHGVNPFRRICLRCPAVVMYRVLTEKVLTQDELRTLAQGGEVPSGFDRKVMLSQAFIQSLKDNDITIRDLSPYAGCMRIAQGTADELVPYEAVHSFACRNGISMVTVPDADHRFTDPAKMDLVLGTFMQFLDLSDHAAR